MARGSYEESEKCSRTHREWKLKKTYGISLDEYEDILYEQDCRCLICGALPGRRALDVDHDHKTGKIRGLLCENCNKTLGQVHDNVEILQNMIDYLENTNG